MCPGAGDGGIISLVPALNNPLRGLDYLNEVLSDAVDELNEEANKAFIATGTAILRYKSLCGKKLIGDDSWNLTEQRERAGNSIKKP